MVYAYDQDILLPTRDIYDTAIMLMSIAAAKDMYEKGQQEMKDFLKAYGDFLTPIQADLDWYSQNVTGKVRDAINALYAQGIDPLRNALGRAYISLIINNIDYGQVNKMKMASAAAQEYIKNRGELMAKGKWNPEMEAYVLGGKSLETWDTSKDGVWTRTSPVEYLSMDDLIEPIVSKIDPTFDAELTAQMNDGYNYSTVSRDRIRATINDNMPDLIAAGTAGGYYYNEAYKAAGGDAEKAREMLKDWYVNRASNHVKTVREADQYRLDDHRTRNDIRAHAANVATDTYYAMLPYADTDGDGKISKLERADYAKIMQYSKSGGNKNRYDDIFEEARDTVDGKIEEKLRTDPTEYVRDTAHYQNILPKDGIQHTVNKDGSTYYTIPASKIGNVMYTENSVGDINSNSLVRYNKFSRTDGEYYFKPTGNIKAKKIKHSNGKVTYRYFLYGTLQHSSDTENDILDAAGSPKTYMMEVTDRRGNYGKKQQKR